MGEGDGRRDRAPDPRGATRHTAPHACGGGTRAAPAWVTTILAFLLVWVALTAPDELSRLTPGAFARLPLEGLLLVGLVLVVPPGARGKTAALVGLILGLLTLVRITNAAFIVALGRPFNPVTDSSYFGSALGLLIDSVGRVYAILLVTAAGALGIALMVLIPLSVRRLTRLVDEHRVPWIRTVTALGGLWIFCAVSGVELVPGTPIASTSAASLAYSEVSRVRAATEDRQAFARAAAVDPRSSTPGDQLLTALRGKDVIVVFVESYGRVALEGSSFTAPVDSMLDAGTSRLRAVGFSSRSAFLTSPTFGGASWLAHSTLHSGLWIDSQQRYNDLVASDRFTLSRAFKRAGWRTVGDVPSNTRDWPEATSFYHYDKTYDARNVGYAGPRFGYATMPDQYVLAAFYRLELANSNHVPVMAEIDLASSHTPWAPLPHLTDWAKVGDGSLFDAMPGQGQSAEYVWSDPERVRTAYAQSIAYSLDTLLSFVQTYPDPDLVLIVLGDHQPASIVSGQGASHDVPITVIAHDPAVLDRIAPWGWQDGMRPGPNAPVWPMDTFRDRFFTAFGPQKPPTR